MGGTGPPSAPSPSHLALHKLLSIALKYLQQPATADTSVHVGSNLMLKLLSSSFSSSSSSSMSVSPKSQAACLSAVPHAYIPLLLVPGVYRHMYTCQRHHHSTEAHTRSHTHTSHAHTQAQAQTPAQNHHSPLCDIPANTHHVYHKLLTSPYSHSL